VVRLITRLNIGGPARQALLLTKRLAPDFPTVLAAGRPGASEGELGDPAVDVIDVPFVRPPSPAMDLRAFGAVRQLLREVQPRIVHTHMAKAGAIGRLAALRVSERPRLVHTFHGHVLEGYFARPVQRAFVEAERWLAARTDVLVAVSPEIRDELVELKIAPESRFQVVPLGLDLDPYLRVTQPSGKLRAALGIGADVPLVGIVGRLVPVKDHSTMLAAMNLLPGVHLAVIGDGELRSRLEAEARQLGLHDRVHFTGWWEDVPVAMSDLDVIALSSRQEGTPVAMIEALATARPVVATDVGGVSHVVTDGLHGYLVPSGDPRTMADRLGDLLGAPGARARMGECGREAVRTKFGQERLVADIRELYQELTGAN